MAKRPAKPRLKVKVLQLDHARDLDLPSYQSEGAAGMDLIAAIPVRKLLKLAPGARALVPTGLMIALPAGYEAQVRPRSGLALRSGITVLNAPGTIDADYRGELAVILVNHGEETVRVRRGDRIAQLVIAPVARAELVSVDVLASTRRGSGGFGSTGVLAGSPAPRRKASQLKSKVLTARGRGLKSRPKPKR